MMKFSTASQSHKDDDESSAPNVNGDILALYQAIKNEADAFLSDNDGKLSSTKVILGITTAIDKINELDKDKSHQITNLTLFKLEEYNREVKTKAKSDLDKSSRTKSTPKMAASVTSDDQRISELEKANAALVASKTRKEEANKKLQEQNSASAKTVSFKDLEIQDKESRISDLQAANANMDAAIRIAAQQQEEQQPPQPSVSFAEQQSAVAQDDSILQNEIKVVDIKNRDKTEQYKNDFLTQLESYKQFMSENKKFTSDKNSYAKKLMSSIPILGFKDKKRKHIKDLLNAFGKLLFECVGNNIIEPLLTCLVVIPEELEVFHNLYRNADERDKKWLGKAVPALLFEFYEKYKHHKSEIKKLLQENELMGQKTNKRIKEQESKFYTDEESEKIIDMLIITTCRSQLEKDFEDAEVRKFAQEKRNYYKNYPILGFVKKSSDASNNATPEQQSVQLNHDACPGSENSSASTATTSSSASCVRVTTQMDQGQLQPIQTPASTSIAATDKFVAAPDNQTIVQQQTMVSTSSTMARVASRSTSVVTSPASPLPKPSPATDLPAIASSTDADKPVASQDNPSMGQQHTYINSTSTSTVVTIAASIPVVTSTVAANSVPHPPPFKPELLPAQATTMNPPVLPPPVPTTVASSHANFPIPPSDFKSVAAQVATIAHAKLPEPFVQPVKLIQTQSTTTAVAPPAMSNRNLLFSKTNTSATSSSEPVRTAEARLFSAANLSEQMNKLKKTVTTNDKSAPNVQRAVDQTHKSAFGQQVTNAITQRRRAGNLDGSLIKDNRARQDDWNDEENEHQEKERKRMKIQEIENRLTKGEENCIPTLKKMENDIHFKVGEMRLEQLTRSITDLERKHLNQVKENKDINSLSDFSTHADNTSKLWSGYVNALLEKKCNLSKEQQEAIECVNEMIKDINITLHGTYDDPLSREPQAKATSSF